MLTKKIFHLIIKKMKRSIEAYKKTWVTTAASVIALVFTVLVSFQVITLEQSTVGQESVNLIIGSIASVITAVSALIAIFKGDA